MPARRVCVRGVERLCVRVCVRGVETCVPRGDRGCRWQPCRPTCDPRVMLGVEPLDPVAPMKAPLATLVSSCFRESMFGK